MSRQHPFVWIRESSRLTALAIATPAVIISSLVMAVVSEPLRNATVPGGILDFEFAGNRATAQAILDSWSPEAREMAMLGMGLDYVYLLVYSVFLSLACIAVARRLSGWAPRAGRLGLGLSWLVLSAGLFDAIENFGLIRLLIDGPSDVWARVAYVCAIPKFIFVGAAGIYAGVGWGASLRLRSERTSAP
jgi:hypothetical protein